VTPDEILAEIEASGLPYDIAYDEDDIPIVGTSEEAQLMRTLINDASPPLPGTDVDEWLERD
jgi:hypothetical protein